MPLWTQSVYLVTKLLPRIIFCLNTFFYAPSGILINIKKTKICKALLRNLQKIRQ